MRYYKVTNISGQKVTLLIKNPDGRELEDQMDVDEVCYGINENAVEMLDWYKSIGLIKIEEADKFPPFEVNWLAEGF